VNIDQTVRYGKNWVPTEQQRMYCRHQSGDSLKDTAESLVAGKRPRPDRLNYIRAVSMFVKDNISYEETGSFPQQADYTLEKAESGNCVDQSVLLMSLLEALDIDARYCCYVRDGKEVGHCLIEVRVPNADRHPSRVERRLAQKAGIRGRLAYDVDRRRAWLLVDPTTPFPTGFERGPAYTVHEDGVRWNRDTNVVCFGPT